MIIKKTLIGIGVLLVLAFILNLVKGSSKFVYAPQDGVSMTISVGAGNLKVNGGSANSSISMDLTHKLLVRPIVKFQENGLSILSKSLDGTILIPNDVSFKDISISSGAGDFGFDLKDSEVENLNLTTGASNVVLFIPKDSTSKIDLGIGAGNVVLTIPTKGKLDGVKIIGQDFSNINLGDAWDKTSDGIQTKEFKSAKITSTLDFSKSGSVHLSIETY